MMFLIEPWLCCWLCALSMALGALSAFFVKRLGGLQTRKRFLIYLMSVILLFFVLSGVIFGAETGIWMIRMETIWALEPAGF